MSTRSISNMFVSGYKLNVDKKNIYVDKKKRLRTQKKNMYVEKKKANLYKKICISMHQRSPKQLFVQKNTVNITDITYTINILHITYIIVSANTYTIFCLRIVVLFLFFFFLFDNITTKNTTRIQKNNYT